MCSDTRFVFSFSFLLFYILQLLLTILMCSKLGKTLGCSVSFFTTSISWIAFPIYSPAALTASFKICLPACLKNPYMISIDSLLRILLFAIFIFCLYLYFVHFVLPTLKRQVELFPWSNYLDENEFT